MKVTFGSPTQEDRALYARTLGSGSILDNRVKVTVEDEDGHSGYLFMENDELRILGEDYVQTHAVLEFNEALNEWFVKVSQNDYYNDELRNPEKVISVRFDGIEVGTGREVYKGIEDGRIFLREVSRNNNFARWLVCGKRRKPDDGNEPRPNLIFEHNGEREKVRYDDWNGVAAYSDTYNPNFKDGDNGKSFNSDLNAP